MCLNTKACLIALVRKLQEKSPLNYPLVRCLSWLLLEQISKNPNAGISNLKRCLNVLTDSGHVEVGKCDTILAQYSRLTR